MPLTMVNVGEQNTIRKITGKDEVRQHLAELGFVVGEKITVISVIGGNMIVSVKNSRIAVDKTMTNRIIV
ncbi:MAG: FeoA family protein [Oscillospiraceae bacterium]